MQPNMHLAFWIANISAARVLHLQRAFISRTWHSLISSLWYNSVLVEPGKQQRLSPLSELSVSDLECLYFYSLAHRVISLKKKSTTKSSMTDMKSSPFQNNHYMKKKSQICGFVRWLGFKIIKFCCYWFTEFSLQLYYLWIQDIPKPKGTAQLALWSQCTKI